MLHTFILFFVEFSSSNVKFKNSTETKFEKSYVTNSYYESFQVLLTVKNEIERKRKKKKKSTLVSTFGFLFCYLDVDK